MSKVYIRSQDRERLVLFGEGISCLHYNLYAGSYPEKDEEKKERHAIFATGNNGSIRLGFYESKERCLELLDEIQQKSASYHRIRCLAQDLLFDMPAVYQMPEK